VSLPGPGWLVPFLAGVLFAMFLLPILLGLPARLTASKKSAVPAK
jgi:hypothetical protein